VGIRLCWHSVCCGCTGNGQCHILAGDIVADVLCSQSAEYQPVATPMHKAVQQSAAVVSLQNTAQLCHELKQNCIYDSYMWCILF